MENLNETPTTGEFKDINNAIDRNMRRNAFMVAIIIILTLKCIQLFLF